MANDLHDVIKNVVQEKTKDIKIKLDELYECFRYTMPKKGDEVKPEAEVHAINMAAIIDKVRQIDPKIKPLTPMVGKVVRVDEWGNKGLFYQYDFGKLAEEGEPSSSAILTSLVDGVVDIQRLFVVTYTDDGVNVYGNYSNLEKLISLMEAIKFDIFVKYGAMVDLRES